MLNYVANTQPPPSAENAGSVTETCQGWAIRALKDLKKRGIVAKGVAAKYRELMEGAFFKNRI
jgi:hypothetical protein